MRIAWVTGARGFIGRRLTRFLSDKGLIVCGVGHGHLPAESWSQAGLATWLNSEISPEALGELAGVHGIPESVFHLAGGSAVGASLQAPYEDFTRTTTTTVRLLEWLRNRAPRAQLVVASSAAVYGDTGGTPAPESRRPTPVSPYGFHKLMMEQLCREYSQVFGLRTAVLRLFSVYGEGLRKQLLWDCAVKLTGAEDTVNLGGSGEELRDWVHIDDAVAMLDRVVGLASDACPIFNGGSGEGVRVRQITALLAQALQRPKRIVFSQVSRRGDPAALVADAARLVANGYGCQIPLNAGIARYAQWFNTARNE